MVSVKRKPSWVLKVFSWRSLVIREKDRRGGGGGGWVRGRANESEVTRQVLMSKKTNLWHYSPSEMDVVPRVGIFCTKDDGQKPAGLATLFCSPDHLHSITFSNIIFFPPSTFPHPFPPPTPSMFGRLVLCARCSVGMSINAVVGRTISAALHLLQPASKSAVRHLQTFIQSHSYSH